MRPLLWSGTPIDLKRIEGTVQPGDCVLALTECGEPVFHRVIRKDRNGVHLRGDAQAHSRFFPWDQVLARGFPRSMWRLPIPTPRWLRTLIGAGARTLYVRRRST